MTRADIEKKSICVNCKWCLAKTIEHSTWTEYQFYCKNAISSIDPVRGDETYLPCIMINSNGECAAFCKPGLSWFEKFLNALTGKKSN